MTQYLSFRTGMLFLLLISLSNNIDSQQIKELFSIPSDSISIGDPFVVADIKSGHYYMVGTTDPYGKMWVSKNLERWAGPFDYLKWNKNSWIGQNPKIWAPEIHEYNDKYYCFATFTNNNIIHGEVNGRMLPRRETHILKGDNPMGPFCEFNSKDYLDANKCTLDGTLYVESDGTPYMVYCYE